MSEEKVRQWCRGFTNGHANVYKERSGRQSIQIVQQKIRLERRLTISALTHHCLDDCHRKHHKIPSEKVLCRPVEDASATLRNALESERR